MTEMNGPDMEGLLRRVGRMMTTVSGDAACLPATTLHNEGWLLRLVLDVAAGLIAADEGLPLPFALDRTARWFSEPLLDSAFLSQFRGDPLAENYTHADAVIGQFAFRADTKIGLRLEPEATHFVV